MNATLLAKVPGGGGALPRRSGSTVIGLRLPVARFGLVAAGMEVGVGLMDLDLGESLRGDDGVAERVGDGYG